MASSSRSERELIELINANKHLSGDELKDLINANSTPMSQEEHDKLMNTVVHVDLDDFVDHINRAKAGDNTVVLNLFPQPRAKPKAKARSKKCSGPATKR